MDLRPGSIAFEKFKIIAPIGEGGMATVYKAKHIHLDKVVVLKLLKTDTENEKTLVRFHSEAKILSQLKHPGISQFFDFGLSYKNEPYLAIEFVEGKTLKSSLKEREHLPIGLALSILLDVCQALSYAHKKGIIHRDVKPGNIMLQDSEGELRAILLDFGIARLITADMQEDQSLTSSGELVGSPRYMSPEQAEGKSIDKTTDLYSIGCVLFEILTGDTPLTGDTLLETINLRKNETAPRLSSMVSYSVPEELDDIAATLLERDKERRYQSIDSLIEDLNILREKLLEEDSEKEKRDVSEFVLSLKVEEPIYMSKRFMFSLLLLAVTAMAGATYYLTDSASRSNRFLASSSSEIPKSGMVKTEKEKIRELEERANGNNLTLPIGNVEDLKKIPEQKNLQVLKIKLEKEIDLDKLMEALGQSKSLIEIYISPNPYKISNLKEVASLPHLLYLEIKGMKIEKKALIDLTGAKNLQVLNLLECGIEEKELSTLSKIKPLRHLYIDEVLAKSNGMKEFRRALPDCNIVATKLVESVPDYAQLYDEVKGGESNFFKERKQATVVSIPSILDDLKSRENARIEKIIELEKRHQDSYLLAKKCYEIAVKAQGANCPSAANYLSEMATFQQVQAKYPEALALLDRSDEVIENCGATRYSSMNTAKRSDIYWIQGKQAESVKLAKEALSLSKEAVIKQNDEPLKMYERVIQRLLDMNENSRCLNAIKEQKKFLNTWHAENYPLYGYYCLWPMRAYFRMASKSPETKKLAIDEAKRIRKLFYALKEEANNSKGQIIIDDQLYAFLEATFTLNCLAEDKEKSKKLLEEAALFIKSNPQMVKRNPFMTWDIFVNLARLSKTAANQGKVVKYYKTALTLTKFLGPTGAERARETQAELDAYVQSQQDSQK